MKPQAAEGSLEVQTPDRTTKHLLRGNQCARHIHRRYAHGHVRDQQIALPVVLEVCDPARELPRPIPPSPKAPEELSSRRVLPDRHFAPVEQREAPPRGTPDDPGIPEEGALHIPDPLNLLERRQPPPAPVLAVGRP